jgi:predicted transcriptional regulator
MSEEVKLRKRGRPSVNIIWPSNQPFTVEDIILSSNVEISKVAVQVKVNQALKNNELVKVGKKETKTGRRPFTYQLTQSMTTPVPNI